MLFHIDEIAGEEILLDADRDNHGKGFSPDDFIVVIENLRKC